jgi:hypothetical protein
MPLVVSENLMVAVTSIVVELTKNHDYITKVEYNNMVWSHLKNVSR